MKGYLEQLLIPEEEIFLLKRNQMPAFLAQHHYHRELEFKYMVSGNGKGYIGDYIYEYGPGDLILVGPNLPHHWVSDNHYASKGTLADCMYLQFKEDFLGADFLDKNVFFETTKLFQKSRQGIQFSGKTAQEGGKLLFELFNAKGFERLTFFLSLLNFLANSYEYKLLTNVHFAEIENKPEIDKLNKIYTYISKNYNFEISLDTAADLVNMSKSSFCQYFKKRTLKSFTEFVNEVRINHAIKLMKEQDLTINQACYQSGFNNISYFNRKFKELMKTSPKTFKIK